MKVEVQKKSAASHLYMTDQPDSERSGGSLCQPLLSLLPEDTSSEVPWPGRRCLRPSEPPLHRLSPFLCSGIPRTQRSASHAQCYHPRLVEEVAQTCSKPCYRCMLHQGQHSVRCPAGKGACLSTLSLKAASLCPCSWAAGGEALAEAARASRTVQSRVASRYTRQVTMAWKTTAQKW